MIMEKCYVKKEEKEKRVVKDQMVCKVLRGRDFVY